MNNLLESKKTTKRINSKQKGNSFESLICKKFSLLLNPLQFKKSAGSGSHLGGQNAKNLDKFSHEIKTIFIGDVCPSNEGDVIKSENWKFRFTIECKFYKSVDTLQQLFKNSKILEWFDQATLDASKLNKEPMLIFKFNHTDIFVGLDSKTYINKDEFSTIVSIQTKDKSRSFNIVTLDELSSNVEWWKQRI